MLFLLASALAADDSVRHYHKGKLSKYELSPPSVMLSDGDEEQIRQGRAIMQVIIAPDGEERRLIMVRDVETPAWVVMDRILDFDAYPRMINGCDALSPYADVQRARAYLPTAPPHITAWHRRRVCPRSGRRTHARTRRLLAGRWAARDQSGI